VWYLGKGGGGGGGGEKSEPKPYKLRNCH